MEVTFENNENNVVFRLSNFDPKYEDVFKMCFYEKDGNSYIKSFSKHIPNLKKIMVNYKENAQEMFDQLGYFKPIPWEIALYEFVKKVDGTDIDWWLTGSCAACIRGIKLNPHDVDIMIDSQYINSISDIFVDYIVEPIIDTGGWLTKDFGVIFNHARIDIASDPQACLDDPVPIDCGPYAKEHLEIVNWKGFEIKVPPLELQLNINRKRGRIDRAKLIQEHMNIKMKEE